MSPQDNSNKKTWTIVELIRWATEDFTKLEIDSPRLDAELLLSHVLRCKRVDLYLRHDEALGKDTLDSFRELVKRRRKREPVAYILGRKAFREIEVKVSPAEFPDIEVSASDISGAALEIAKENTAQLGLEGRINFIQGDSFSPFSEGQCFDLIVSNPPYIPTGVIPSLMPEVRDFEPREALDGGKDGLEFIFAILVEAPAHLSPGGWLWLEIGDGQAERIIDAAKEPLIHKETINDYSGIARILGFKKK
jgi:release factor glutamine methyltransferase